MVDLKVSFVVIALNAASTLTALFKCLKRQTYPHKDIEVILVDGKSSDETKQIMNRFAADNDFCRTVILDNEGKTLPCGWNVALAAVQGDAILRVDAHTTFPPEFIAKNVYDLSKGEEICGGKVISVPSVKTNWSITLNEAENSMFGGSFATFRHADKARYVSTAAFAIYRKEVFDKVGSYNELLTRTEDNEMHYRMKQAGYKFYYDPEIVSYRETRGTLGRLLKQKYLNGYWIGVTTGIEPRCFSVYHFVPLVFIIAIIVTTFISFIGIILPAKLLWLAYTVVNILMTVITVIDSKDRNIDFICIPVIFLMLHLWYGIGTLVGVIKMINSKIKHEILGGVKQSRFYYAVTAINVEVVA